MTKQQLADRRVRAALLLIVGGLAGRIVDQSWWTWTIGATLGILVLVVLGYLLPGGWLNPARTGRPGWVLLLAAAAVVVYPTGIVLSAAMAGIAFVVVLAATATATVVLLLLAATPTSVTSAAGFTLYLLLATATTIQAVETLRSGVLLFGTIGLLSGAALLLGGVGLMDGGDLVRSSFVRASIGLLGTGVLLGSVTLWHVLLGNGVVLPGEDSVSGAGVLLVGAGGLLFGAGSLLAGAKAWCGGGMLAGAGGLLASTGGVLLGTGSLLVGAGGLVAAVGLLLACVGVRSDDRSLSGAGGIVVGIGGLLGTGGMHSGDLLYGTGLGLFNASIVAAGAVILLRGPSCPSTPARQALAGVRRFLFTPTGPTTL